MRSIRIILALALGTSLFGLPAPGDAVAQEREAGRGSPKLEAINASYRDQLREIERRWIADLAGAAASSSGPDANELYRQAFNLAIARNLCREAQAAAGNCLASSSTAHDVRALAALAQLLARAENGEHDQSLADLKTLFSKPGAGTAPAAALDAESALAVGEAYLQRLIRDGRYDVARKVCALACHVDAAPALKDHFEDRMTGLDLVGKAAPPITGTDVDGHPVSLADLTGKVVLVDFWATWCPPCVASIPGLNALAQKYHDRGFVILGVNVDAMHEDATDMKAALAAVRLFLVEHRVTWTNVLNGKGTADFATAYGVEQIPANFLIGRDGTIVAVEQSGEMLDRAVQNALGGAAGADAK
jgi:thiol-disulfide isomerase/thioredoxin